jgi:2-polyprenyl-3-methyl-5-hydroxy-6-metoxy-1,4-benzoquinol methylase
MADLTTRSREDEQMDAEDLDVAVYEQVLRDLARVNLVTFTAHPTLAYLNRATQGMKRFRLLDVGFGHGDLLRSVAGWASKRGIEAELIGVDLNSRSREIAEAATPARMRIDYRTGDYKDQPERWDFVVSSQVTHHMTDAQLIAFVQFMEREARKGWLIVDLHRHGFAHWGYPLLARLLMVHRIVREDGRLSIARSFRRGEWEKLLGEAGIPTEAVRIVRRFAFRLCVERVRP